MARFNTALTSSIISGTATIGTPYSGAFTEFTGTAPYTVTLPSPVTFPGVNQTFYNATSGTVTLSTPAGNFVGAGGSGTATVTVPTTSTINLVSDGVNYVVVGEDGTSLTATTGAFSGNVTINGAGATLSITPQTVTIAPGGTSTIDNINIGATTRGSGAFTTLASNNAVTFTAGTASSSTGTGTLVVTGGIGASGNIYAGGTVSANALSGPLTGTIQTAAQPNITSLGNLTALNVTYTGGSIYTNTAGGIPRLYIGGGNGFGFNRQTASEDIFFNEPGDTGTFRIRGAGTISLGVGNTATSMTIGGNGGNVGINATTPGEKLDIQDSGDLKARIYTTGTTTSTHAGLTLKTGSYEYIIQNLTTTAGSVGALRFYDITAGAERLRVDSSGNLLPGADNTLSLGSSVRRWNNYYGTVDNTVNINTNATTAKPTIVFDFGGSQAYDPRLSFFRLSNATYYNAEGFVSSVSAHQPRIDFNPATGECRGLLIEESRSNVMGGNDNLMSAIYFGNVTYNGCNAIQPATVLAPDGSYSAIKITEDKTNARHETNLALTPTVATWTLSVFAKAAERSTLSLAWAGYPSATFNLTAGTAVTSGSATATIYPITNGWYRCAITISITSASITTMYMGIEVPGDNGFIAHQGDGSSGLYIWGVQMESGGFLTSYVPSTTTFTFRNSTGTFTDPGGFIRSAPINYPRYNYVYDGANWVSAGLLLEPASTNLLATSSISAFSTGQNLNTASAPGVVSPDGTTTAVWKMTPNTSNSSHSIYYPHPVTSAAQRTVSGYFKGAGYNYIRIYCDGGSTYNMGNVLFGLVGNGTAVLDGSALAGTYSYGIQNAGNGWYRCWVTGAMDGAQCYYHIDVYNNAPSPSYAGDGTSGVYGWGIQSELGTVITSYIPTTGATATRSIDAATTTTNTRAQDNAVMYNAASYLNNQQSTVVTTFASLANPTAGGTPGVFELVQSSGTFGGTGQTIMTGGLDMRTGFFYLGDNYAVSTGYTPSTTVTFTTIAAAYGAANSAVYTNGAAQGTDNVHTVNFNFNMILLGNIDKPAGFNTSGSPQNTIGNGYPLNGWMKKWTYYPLRLVNAELAEISGT